MPAPWPTPGRTDVRRCPRRVVSERRGALTRAASDSDLRRITDDYRRGGSVAVEAGFDCLEIHLGHNYLLSSFLSPRLNRRKDRWGGSLENRARFPRQVVAAVREGADGVNGEWWRSRPNSTWPTGCPAGSGSTRARTFARMLESDGGLDALVLTGGSSLSNPMYLFRGEAPRREFAATLPLTHAAWASAWSGPRFLRDYPFEEAFFLPYARQFREAVSLPLVLLGGINRLDTAEMALAEGFSFVAMARALLAASRTWWRVGRRASRSSGSCIHCNKCMPTIYSGTRCVLESTRPLGVTHIDGWTTTSSLSKSSGSQYLLSRS